MPIYDFKCQQCGIVFEAITSSDQQQVLCVGECSQTQDGALADKQLSAPAYIQIH